MQKTTETRGATANISPFGFRMQAGLRKQLEDSAHANNRSLNAEITARLEASFDSPETAHAAREMVDMLATMESRLAEIKVLREEMDAVSLMTIKTLVDSGVKLPKRFADRLKKPKA
jgi:hypothetical protein